MSIAQAQNREDGGGGGGRVLFLMPALDAGLSLQFAGQPARVAQRRGHFRLGAAGGQAVLEMGLVVGDDVVGGRGRQADKTVLQTGDEFRARHWAPSG